MTSHHQPNSEFSRSAPWAAEKAADTRPSLLPVSAANYHGQHGSTHERGRGVPYELGINLVCRASIPADPRRACSQSANLRRLRLYDDVSLKLGRGRVALGPLGRLSGCVNTQLAKPVNHPLSDSRLKNFAKGSEHSKISVRLGPEPSEGGKNAIHENPTSGATHDR